MSMVLSRTIAGFKFQEYWYDVPAYLASSASINAIRTDDAGVAHDISIPEKTVCLDCKKTPDALWQEFESRARHSIESFDRTGTMMFADTPQKRQLFYAAYKEFATRQGLLIPQAKEEESLDIFLAYSHDNELVHAVAFLPVQSQSLYIYRYSVSIKKSQANAALIWKALCHAHSNKFAHFDLGGIPTDSDCSAKLKNILFFKSQFGGVEKKTFFYLRGNGLLGKLCVRMGGKLLRHEKWYQRIVPVVARIMGK